MGPIAGISLLLGGIGLMNIMLATVLERTREIDAVEALRYE
jgi:putative ABC transport system permease protein